MHTSEIYELAPAWEMLEQNDPEALTRRYEYYDPIGSLPQAGQDWWREQAARA